MREFFELNSTDVVLSQEQATSSFRWKKMDECHMVLQQAWHCVVEYSNGTKKYSTEWRKLEAVDASAPDVEPLT